MDARKTWFKAKRYGWGWYPASWEGWLVMSAYVIFLVSEFSLIEAASPTANDAFIAYTPRFLLATFTLIAVCYWKGEKPGWRWGGKDLFRK